MGAPTPFWVRQRIIEARRNGERISAIAQRYGVSRTTVTNLWRRYQRQGPDGLAADYSACGRPANKGRLYRAARYLKYLHRSWGAPLIRTLLIERYGPHVPSARTLQRWFTAATLTVPRQKRPPVDRDKGQAVHAVWQIDAKERLPMQACYLSIVDEYSGALLEAPVFPLLSYQPGAAEADATGADCDF